MAGEAQRHGRGNAVIAYKAKKRIILPSGYLFSPAMALDIVAGKNALKPTRRPCRADEARLFGQRQKGVERAHRVIRRKPPVSSRIGVSVIVENMR